MVNQHNHDVKHMLLASAVLSQRNQKQLKSAEGFLHQRSNAATHALQSALSLDADNQQRP
ncbi:hypothetical protein ACRPOS_006565 [Bartonella heixiaziensis]|uniref:hypothetical protein n=1 Tax=Bartonella heixiaziensis TaxID=1461000 RepID=UPI0039088796